MPLIKEEEPRGLKNFPSCPCCLWTWRRGYEIQDGGKSERRTLLGDWQLVLSLLRLSSWQQHAKCEQSKIFNIINQFLNLIYMENVFSSSSFARNLIVRSSHVSPLTFAVLLPIITERIANIWFLFLIQGSVTLRSRRRNSWYLYFNIQLTLHEWMIRV